MCLNHSLVKGPGWHSLSCDSQLSSVLLQNPWDKSWFKSPSPVQTLLLPVAIRVNKIETQGAAE